MLTPTCTVLTPICTLLNFHMHCAQTHLHCAQSHLHRAQTNLHHAQTHLHRAHTRLHCAQTHLHCAQTHLHCAQTHLHPAQTHLYHAQTYLHHTHPLQRTAAQSPSAPYIHCHRTSHRFVSALHTHPFAMSTRGAITYLFCLLLPACAVAQQHVADSLAAVVRAKGPTVQLLNDLAWAYMFHLPDSGLSIALRSAQLARSSGDLAGQAQALNRAGVAYDVKDMPDSALALYERALPVAERSADDKVLAGVLNNMGMVHWNLGANDRALELYLRATAIFERTDNLKGLSNTYNNIGLILLDENGSASPCATSATPWPCARNWATRASWPPA